MGSVPAFNALLGNVVNLSFDTRARAQIRDGKVKGRSSSLAGSARRSSRTSRLQRRPAFPTSQSIPGSASLYLRVTSTEIVQRLNAEVARIGTMPDVRARLEARGLRVTTSTPQGFADTIKTDHGRWGKVIKDSGVEVF
jgi:tripartite-type tricarboxylate transporter receptor subunit TctC